MFYVKAAVLQIIHKIISYIFYIEIKNPTYFHFFALKTDSSFFCHWDIPTVHNGYCVSNAIDYAKKNDVLPTIC